MNERIRELAEVARTWAENKFDKNQQAPGLYYHVDVVEKFAELIVKECGVALSPMLRDMVSRGQAYDLIKQHFGVKE